MSMSRDMMEMHRAVIVETIRTPRRRGRPLGGRNPCSLAGVHPQELAAQVQRAVVERTGVPVSDVNDVFLGCVSQVDEQGANIARHSALAAGWPNTVRGVTLARACGSDYRHCTTP